MSKYRRAAKVDKNQSGIVSALRKIPGLYVETGHDDLLIGWQGRTYWYEVKSADAVSKRTGNVLKSAKKESQLRLEREWTGHYRIVSGLDEILEDMGL